MTWKSPIALMMALLWLPAPVDAGQGQLSRKARRAILAADRAPKYLVNGNMPGSFRVRQRHTVRPGTTAFVGKDARNRSIWVVDHRSTYNRGPADITKTLMEGFFTGACSGRLGNGPRMRLIATHEGGKWQEPGAGAHTSRGVCKSPLINPRVDKFIVEVKGVRPVPSTKAVLKSASFQMVIHRSSIKRQPGLAEFTGHFLNPDRQRGPFPGTTDGALRIRARQLGSGRVALEEYYITRSATEFVDSFNASVKPLAVGNSLFQLGRGLMNLTPPGMLFKPVTDQGFKMAKGMMDTTVKHAAGKGIWNQVARFHTDYWENTMFRNLLQAP